MKKKIHILGASGSGTTTLASEISNEFGHTHFDADDYFWIKTDIPFTIKREVNERIELLSNDMYKTDIWVLSGSIVDWGDLFIPEYDLVIYLSLPTNIRLERLHLREYERYGKRILKGNDMYDIHQDFLEWTSKYDDGDLNIRSKKLHNEWLKKIKCDIVRIEEDISISDKINILRDIIAN